MATAHGIDLRASGVRAVHAMSSSSPSVSAPGRPLGQGAHSRRVPSGLMRAWLESALAFARAWPEVVIAMLAGVTARAVFWQMTHRMFEDGLITITHARNAAEGLGLTHHPGEGHVHGFTSALSVLVPLLGELVKPGGGGFVAIRLASMA